MSNFEELKTFKIKDANLSQEEFYNVMRDKLTEQSETDELVAKGFSYEMEFEDKLAEAIANIFTSPTYFKRATMQLGFQQILKEAHTISKQIEYEKSLVVVESFVGCFVGGQDWTGLADKHGIPMKQDLVFLMQDTDDEGEINVIFKPIGIFGNDPIRDYEGELKIGSWYEVGLIEKEGKNKKIYKNVGTFEEVKSVTGLPTLSELMDIAKISIFDISFADGEDYNYLVVKGQIRNVAAVPIWDDDMTKPIIHLKDRQGKLMYDDEGNKEMGYPQAIVGYEPLRQKSLQGKETIDTMYFRFQDNTYPVDDEEEDVFFEARFHNQHFGKTQVNLDLSEFIDEDVEEEDAEQLATLVGDHFINVPVKAIVKMTKVEADKNNDKLVWARSNALYIEQD